MVFYLFMTDIYFKLPRLFCTQPLQDNDSVILGTEQTHYLKNVLRLKPDSQIRLFDGQSGEWLGQIKHISKKDTAVTLEKKIADQPITENFSGLIFTPIKKQRLDMMIEKAVELGITDFYPVLTQNTEIRKINQERLKKQILEAAEQCERFTIPTLHRLQNYQRTLTDLKNHRIHACLERYERTENIKDHGDKNFAVMIGPEGGFTDDEKSIIAKKTKPISLGDTVLRCETAAIKAIILLQEAQQT